MYEYYPRGYQADTVRKSFCQQSRSTLSIEDGQDRQKQDNMKSDPATKMSKSYESCTEIVETPQRR